MNRSWPERHHHRRQVIRRRLDQYRNQSFHARGTGPDHAGRLDKSRAYTFGMWCLDDYNARSRGHPVERHKMLTQAIDRDAARELAEMSGVST